jgi:hypothetical protein
MKHDRSDASVLQQDSRDDCTYALLPLPPDTVPTY